MTYNYILKNRKIKDTPSTRNNYEQKIKRCNYLYDKYKENLNLVYFSINKISRLSN